MSKGTRQGPAARTSKGDTREHAIRVGGEQRRKRTLLKRHADPVNLQLMATEMHDRDGRDYQVRRIKGEFGLYLREDL